MDRIEISKATDEQLRDFATTILGIEIDGRWKAPKIIEAINTATGQEMKSIPLVKVQTGPALMSGLNTGDPIPSKVVKAKAPDGQIYERKFYMILIPTSDMPGGHDPVPVSVNGRAMFIERGKPQEVPEEYVRALQYAVRDDYPEYTEGKGGLGKPTKVSAFPFNFVGAVAA